MPKGRQPDMLSSPTTLQPLCPSDISAAARLCAFTMADNPLHIRVFGQDAIKRQRRLNSLFRGLLPYVASKGQLIGAYHNGQLLGVLGRLAPHGCQPCWRETLTLVPALLASNSPLGWLRTGLWLTSWAKFDPITPHWHLGPLAVSP